MTASAHPVVFRPVITRLRDAGHEVEITARDYAQTLGLLKLHGLDYVAIGQHAGASRTRKAMALGLLHRREQPRCALHRTGCERQQHRGVKPSVSRIRHSGCG